MIFPPLQHTHPGWNGFVDGPSDSNWEKDFLPVRTLLWLRRSVRVGSSGGQVEVIDNGPEVRLRSWFERPYDDAISAARTCYSTRVIDTTEITESQRRNIGPLTFDGGHHTVYQHATFEFALSGISRQLVWSVLHGFPFYNTEQQSQRYVKLNEVSATMMPGMDSEVAAITWLMKEGSM